jgi:hypothetical protein
MEVAKAPTTHDAEDIKNIRSLLASQDGSRMDVWLSFRVLNVSAPDSRPKMVKTLPRVMINTFGYDQVSWLLSMLPRTIRPGGSGPFRKILSNCTGLVEPGELLLVLGSPDAASEPHVD